MPCDPCEHECRPRDGGSLLRPSPALLEAVDGLLSKAPPVLAKRSAEGRASKWATAKTRTARKAAMCDVCQETDGAGVPKGPHEPAVKVGARHRDKNGSRCCWTCWERLESEAAGAGKGAA